MGAGLGAGAARLGGGGGRPHSAGSERRTGQSRLGALQEGATGLAAEDADSITADGSQMIVSQQMTHR